MENQVQRRDRDTRNLMTPPRTVLVDNWKGTGRRARINVADYDPSRDGEIVPGSEHQHYGVEVASFSDELHRQNLASYTHKRATGVTGDATA